MKQYLKLLSEIQKSGTHKPAARDGMPGTTSLFGYQFRHNLQDGFPLLTTKKMFWKGIGVELLWFLNGDTNIKYLVDNGVGIWNQDAYNFYIKKCKEYKLERNLNFDEFINFIKDAKTITQLRTDSEKNSLVSNPLIPKNYVLGDCGYQYGKVWRKWEKIIPQSKTITAFKYEETDQVLNLIKSLKNNPESRRHIITALDPAHENDLALYWCHAMFQFNCRPINNVDRAHWAVDNCVMHRNELMFEQKQDLGEQLDENNIPKYYLDCQLYQRSADVFLGVPFNIASYALLTHILAKMCNMVPGEFVHTFGDVHIYDNHMESVNEQLKREPSNLPKFKFSEDFKKYLREFNNGNVNGFDDFILKLSHEDFVIENYNPMPSIKGKLSTGMNINDVTGV